MPTLSKDMIAEIEHEMADLVEENAMLREINAALKAALQQEKVEE